MRVQRSLLVLITTVFSAPVGHSADVRFPIVDSVGFDWLKPESARCARTTESLAQRFTQCEFHDSGAFGLDLAYHACRVSGRSEYLLFASESACNEALEAMQANAP